MKQASASSHFLAGVRAALTMTPGVASWGMISGVAMVGAGLPPLAAMAMALFVFAGASQLAALQLIGAGAALPIALFAGFIINLRFVLFSLSLAPYLRHLSPGRRAWYSYILSDNGYATSLTYFDKHPNHPERHLFLHGFGLTIWCTWELATLAGVILGAAVPASWGLEFTIVLTFIALLAPQVKYRANAVAAITAGVFAVITASLPFRLGLIVSAAAAIVVGMAFERAFPAKQLKQSSDG